MAFKLPNQRAICAGRHIISTGSSHCCTSHHLPVILQHSTHAVSLQIQDDENFCFIITVSSTLIYLSKAKMALFQFNHPTRLIIPHRHLFVWVDLYNGVLGLSTVLKGIITLPQLGLETPSTISSFYKTPPTYMTHTNTNSSIFLCLNQLL